MFKGMFGSLGTMLSGMIFIAVFLGIAVYIYAALAWQEIAKRQNYKYSWFAWVPVLNIVMILELGRIPWGWIFLIFIPIFGWIALGVLGIISIWRIFEKENYPGWFSLSTIIPKVGMILFLIALGFVAWKPKLE